MPKIATLPKTKMEAGDPNMDQNLPYKLKCNSHQDNLSKRLYLYYKKEKYTDVVISLLDGQISCHRAVLASNSVYFQRMFDKNPSDSIIILADIMKDDFEPILEYMYLGELIVMKQNIEEVIELAKYLKVRGLCEDPEDLPLPEPQDLTNGHNDSMPGPSRKTGGPSSTITSNDVDMKKGEHLINGSCKKSKVDGLLRVAEAAEVVEARKGRKGYHPKKAIRWPSPPCDQVVSNGHIDNSPQSEPHPEHVTSPRSSTETLEESEAPMVIDEGPMDFSSRKDQEHDLEREIAEKKAVAGKRSSIFDKFSTFIRRQRHSTDDGGSTSSATHGSTHSPPPQTLDQQRKSMKDYLELIKRSNNSVLGSDTLSLSELFGIDFSQRLRQHFMENSSTYNNITAAAATVSRASPSHSPALPQAGGYDFGMGFNGGSMFGAGGIGYLAGAHINHAAAGNFRSKQQPRQPRKNKRGGKGPPASANISLDEFGKPKVSQSGKPMVRCEKCGKELADPSSLYRHRKIHSGDKPHQCPFCQRKFIQRYNMRQHLKTHRKSGIPQELIDSLPEELREAFYGRKSKKGGNRKGEDAIPEEIPDDVPEDEPLDVPDDD